MFGPTPLQNKVLHKVQSQKASEPARDPHGPPRWGRHMAPPSLFTHRFTRTLPPVREATSHMVSRRRNLLQTLGKRWCSFPTKSQNMDQLTSQHSILHSTPPSFSSSTKGAVDPDRKVGQDRMKAPQATSRLRFDLMSLKITCWAHQWNNLNYPRCHSLETRSSIMPPPHLRVVSTVISSGAQTCGTK